MTRDDGSDPDGPVGDLEDAADARPVADIPVAAGSVRWERPTARSFWNALADPEREALAAAGVEEIFRPGAVLCRAGDDASQVMIIDSGWVKVSVREGLGAAEKILAVRGQGDRRRLLGQDHPDTLTTRGTLAWTIELQRRYADAEQQYRSVLADRERILGASHPDTLIARQDVARMLGMQRRYAEAERLTREILADRRRLLGDDHPDTLTSRAILARLAARQGRGAEAEGLYRQVIADRTRVLGSGHPDTAALRDEFAQRAAS